MNVKKRLKRFFSLFSGGDYIRWSNDYKELRSECKWELIKETDEGIKLRKKKCKEMKHMETGEITVIYRADTEIEWYDYQERDDWPEEAIKSLQNGEVWESELSDDRVPDLWGALRDGGMWKIE